MIKNKFQPEALRYAGIPDDSKLDEFGLTPPPLVFRAATATRGVADTYQGVKVYSNAEMIALIEKEHGTLDGIETDRLAFWRAVVSNSSLDTYFTRMAKSSLINYAADASSPTVSFQNSHRHDELAVGRSVVGQFIESGNAPQGANPQDYFPAVIVDFYSHRDLQLGSVSVEQFLLGIKSHVVKDVSIGFKEGAGFQYTCSVCGENYFSWDCRHIAGVEYSVAADDDDPTDTGDDKKRLCFVWVENARLSEVSAVYDGATTNAMIIKAERESRAGRLESDVEKYLERRYRFRAAKDVQFTGIGDGEREKRKPSDAPDTETANTDGEKPNSNENRGNETMSNKDENGTANTPDLTPQIRAFGRELGFEIADDATAEKVFETVRAEFSANKTKAGKYDELRKAEIETAISEKIRAEGGVEQFDEEKQKSVRSMLENCGIEAVKEFAGEWRNAGDKRFGKQRQSVDEADAPESEKNESDKERKTDTPEIFNTIPPHYLRGGV